MRHTHVICVNGTLPFCHPVTPCGSLGCHADPGGHLEHYIVIVELHDMECTDSITCSKKTLVYNIKLLDIGKSVKTILLYVFKKILHVHRLH